MKLTTCLLHPPITPSLLSSMHHGVLSAENLSPHYNRQVGTDHDCFNAEPTHTVKVGSPRYFTAQPKISPRSLQSDQRYH